MIELDLCCSEQQWGDTESLSALISRAFAQAILITGKDLDQNYLISVALNSDVEMRDLNARFRQIDKPTNVLSFPAPEGQPKHTDLAVFLGDIAFAYGVISTEARQQNKTFDDHLSHLAIHGLLHLLGHDHMHDDEARIMEDLEVAALAKLNIANPYQDQLSTSKTV